jgi:hypothetical protein
MSRKSKKDVVEVAPHDLLAEFAAKAARATGWAEVEFDRPESPQHACEMLDAELISMEETFAGIMSSMRRTAHEIKRKISSANGVSPCTPTLKR